MRTIKELLGILKYEVETPDWRSTGLCGANWTIYHDKDLISKDEHELLIKWLDENLPERTWPNSLLLDEFQYDDKHKLVFCWKMYDAVARILWLEEQIYNMD